MQLSSPLTEREQQVLGLLATKLSTGEIADQLFVSINTVRMHTKSVYSKLDVHSRLEAIERARELGVDLAVIGPSPSTIEYRFRGLGDCHFADDSLFFIWK